MKNSCFKIVVGFGLGTFFSTEVVHTPSFALNDKAFAAIPVIQPYYRDPATFAPSTNNHIITLRNQTFDRNLILDDFQNKISPEFRVSPDLRERVTFWFDIYTKYTGQQEVLHHAQYPWIIFRVVDLKPILDASGNKWVNYHKSVDYSKKQRKEVRDILWGLYKKKSFLTLTDQEQEIYEQLLRIPGKNFKKIILGAVQNLRTQVGQKDFIEKGIEASSLYLPQLEKVFAEKGLPTELTRLPFVESSFNVDAVSKVGASGIWQVMPYIGKKFLVMNDAVDERNSPVKAAESAAFILKQNKQILKTWPLALTAYNHGAGSLTKAVKKAKTRDLEYLINHSLGFASENFYASFLAILHAEKYRDQVYDTLTPQSPLQFRELKLTQSVRLRKLLQTAGITNEEFQKYNLDVKRDAYRKNMLLPKGYIIHIPSTIVSEFITKKQKVAKLIEDPSTNSL
jgi:membrane-bound lytic murein transglycosylase D